MSTFNWKELQESEARLFDEKFLLKDTSERAVTFLNQPNIIQDTLELKSHLLSSNQRSAQAVIEAMRERLPEKAILLEELEAQIK